MVHSMYKLGEFDERNEVIKKRTVDLAKRVTELEAQLEVTGVIIQRLQERLYQSIEKQVATAHDYSYLWG